MTTSLLNGLMRAGATALVCSAVAMGAAQAHAETTNLGELKAGVPTEYPGGYGVVEATFMTQEDGPMRVFCTGDFLNAYSDAEHENIIASDFSYVNGVPMREYQVKKDQMVYFYNSFCQTAGKITVYNGEMKIALEETYPSDNPESMFYYGGEFSISLNYRVRFEFNMPISCSGARMSVNGTNTVNLNPDIATNAVEMTIAPTLMQMYKEGKLKKGDNLRVEVLGIAEKDNAENVYNGDGVAAVEYKMCGKPIELVSTTNTPDSGMSDMLSYYAPGNPKAIVSLTFSGDVDTSALPKGQLQYGDVDNVEAGIYDETLEAQVEGPKVSIDLAGTLRRPQDMIPGIEKPLDNINLVVTNVRDTEGQYAYNGNLIAPLSYGYTYTLKTVQYNVASDFTPTASKGLTEGQDMEIFVMDGTYTTFSGVKFSYKAGGEDAVVLVTNDELTIETEATTDLVITLKAPALPGIDEGSDVTVTLNDLRCDDGLDHTDQVTCVYSKYVSGLEDVIAADTEAGNVYNAQGILVLKGAKASQVRQLPAGLYIMDGRKVMVK